MFIAGAIGPLGGPVKGRDAAFAEQAQLLEGRGVDLFMIETFYELDELLTAIRAVRGVSGLPIVSLLTFDEDAQTLGGVSAEEAASALADLDVAAIGANHGLGLQAALRAIERMGDGGKPLAALPNVGLASLAGERVIFPHATPDYFAEFAAHARELGARIIGGCCGTTPTEIAAIRSAVDEDRSPRPGSSYASARSWSQQRSPSARRCCGASCARASSSSPWRSTRHEGETPTRCSNSREPSRRRGTSTSSTSTTTRAHEPG